MGKTYRHYGKDGTFYDTWDEMRKANARWEQQEKQNKLIEEQNKLLENRNKLLEKQQKELEKQTELINNTESNLEQQQIDVNNTNKSKKEKMPTTKEAIKRNLEQYSYDDILKYLELQNYEEICAYRDSYKEKIHLLPTATNTNIRKYENITSEKFWGTFNNRLFVGRCSKELDEKMHDINVHICRYKDKYLEDYSEKYNKPKIGIFILKAIIWCLILCPIFYFLPYIFTLNTSPLLAIISGILVLIDFFLNFSSKKHQFEIYDKEKSERLSKINKEFNEYNTLAKEIQEKITQKSKKIEENRIKNFNYELEFILEEIYNLGLRYNEYPSDYQEKKAEYFEKIENDYLYFTNLTIDTFCQNFNEKLQKYYELFGEKVKNEQLESTDINSYYVTEEDFSEYEFSNDMLVDKHGIKFFVAVRNDIKIGLLCNTNGIVFGGNIGKIDEIDYASDELGKRLYLPFLSAITHKDIKDSVKAYMSMLDTDNYEFKESFFSYSLNEYCEFWIVNFSTKEYFKDE